MRAHIGLARLFAKGPSQILRYGLINGLQIEDGKIVAIYVMRNPDKLRRIH